MNDKNLLYNGICKCCLEDGKYKSMWMEYVWNGEKEVYGEIISKCFSLAWHESPEHIELICDICIIRLREAHSFKEQILNSDLLLYEQFKVPIKTEPEIQTVIISDDNIPIKEEPNLSEHNNMDYLVVEYLDEEEDVTENQDLLVLKEDEPLTPPKRKRGRKPLTVKKASEDIEVDTHVDPDTLSEEVNSDTEKPKRKWPKKKKKGERTKSYKNYTETDLRECLNEIWSEKLSIAEASKKYNVPRKTLAYKVIQPNKKRTPEELSRMEQQEKQHRFLEEIKTILNFTNATPFKNNYSQFYCAYCNDTTPFEDTDDLRMHVRVDHVAERIKGVDQMMRPIWKNQILRLDIDNLQCTSCYIGIPSWNDMFKHLKEHHDINLDEAYSRVIPFVLKDDYRCTLCNENFPNHHVLDGHMNAHYTNFICPECGDPFLTKYRLNKHVQIHDVGKYPCPFCKKVFTLEKYRRKHVIYNHVSNSFKCKYCEEKFHSDYQRHMHVLNSHREKVKMITCEICGTIFDWKPYYMKHLKRYHGSDKRYKCKTCSMQFFSIIDLREHKLSHTGEKHHACTKCDKKYTNLLWLKHHLKLHERMEKAKERSMLLDDLKQSGDVDETAGTD